MRRAVGKCAVAIIVKKSQRLADVVAGNGDIQKTVVFEIIRNHAAGHGNEIQACCGRRIHESSEILLCGKDRRRNQVFLRHAVGIFSQGHISQIQQPLHLDGIRPFGYQFEIFGEVVDSLFRISGLLVTEVRARRKSASVDRVAINVVCHFRFVQVSDAECFRQLRNPSRHIRDCEFVSGLPLPDGCIHVASIGLELR